MAFDAKMKTTLKTPPTQHTPLPWRIQGNFIGSPDATIAEFRVSYLLSDAESRANAELIVRAVNSHSKLVDALRFYAAAPWLGHAGNWANSAIAKRANDTLREIGENVA